MTEIRLSVRVKPGSSRPRVGGRYGDDTLIVAVSARPVDGAANEAVIAAVADAFSVRRSDVRVASGHTARTKTIAITVPEGSGSAIIAQRDLLLDV